MKINKNGIDLYVHTLKYMKCSQVYYRIRKLMGIECGIGVRTKATADNIHPICSVPALDFDPVFLSRFNVCDLMNDRVSFLHSEAVVDWNGRWEIKEKSSLWNYNLHYFEYVFPLFNAYQTNHDEKYLKKAVSIIRSWIKMNPQKEGGPGWAPYTIDLRLTNWLSFYSMAEKYLTDAFKREMRCSIKDQYDYLSKHVEKDILGNHYLEDLKTLVLCAVFFNDQKMMKASFDALIKECHEEILDDGMHFELSPMYHNLVLESLIKTYSALKEYGYQVKKLENPIQAMLNAAWSMGESLDRIPFFNDCGNNVAKSLDSLVTAAESLVDTAPVYKNAFPDAGFYILKRGDWKLIIDGGKTGPDYIPGHAHCDALSFELFHHGAPIIVNCGTYAYQSSRRDEFRQTKAHNTVMLNGYEQSEMWGIFRVARRCNVNVIEAGSDHLIMEMTDYRGVVVRRTITLGDKLVIFDESKNSSLTGYLHFKEEIPVVLVCSCIHKYKQCYAPDYGVLESINTISYEGRDCIRAEILLGNESENI